MEPYKKKYEKEYEKKNQVLENITNGPWAYVMIPGLQIPHLDTVAETNERVRDWWDGFASCCIATGDCS